MNCQLIAGEALGLTGNPTGLMTADLVFKARSARASSPMNLLGPSDRKPSLGSLLEVVHLGSFRSFTATIMNDRNGLKADLASLAEPPQTRPPAATMVCVRPHEVRRAE
jgi:hypothetical protein